MDQQDGAVFTVLVNDEEQYSLWDAGRPLPAGWRETGARGTRQECLAYVDATWTDLRPLSLRQRQAARQADR
ncbi:MbtH family NRPS accessory protein [Kitasatospora sp. NPDC047058]|uniref:MbtH family protein n=1 Tax=Kitasatospora sp. NPDC047058 TaxID=3155620 RepID=UPI0034099E4F